MRSLRNTERVMMNAGVARLLDIEHEKGAALKIHDIIEQVAGIYPKVMVEGELDAGKSAVDLVRATFPGGSIT